MSVRVGRPVTEPGDVPEPAERAQTILDNLPIAFFSVDRQFRLTFANAMAERLMQKPRSEIMGRNLWEEFPEAIDSPFYEAGLKAVDEPAVVDLEVYYQPRDMWFEVHADPIEGGFDVFVRDITETRKAREALRRRDAILEAVRYAAERFLRDPSWTDGIGEVLSRLGRATGVSRVYVFENHAAEDGGVRLSQRYEWVAEGIAPLIDDPLLQDFSLREQGTGRWEEVLGSGGVISGHVRALPKRERPVLELQDILSIAVVPIFVGEEWWGFIGFDECAAEREWSVAEIDALKAASNALGAAIERRHSEERIREAEAKYRNLVEQMPAVTYIDSLDGCVTSYVSPQYEKLFGYSPEERIADPDLWSRLLHPDDRKRALEESDRADRTGEPFRSEYRLIARDGRVVWVHDEAYLVRDDEGNPIFWQGILFDITDRKEAEERLREAEAKYRTLVEQLPVVVHSYAIDTTPSRPTYISPQIEALFGYTPEQWLADPLFWVNVIHQDDRERVLAEDARTSTPGGSFSMEYRVVARDGRVVWVRDEAIVRPEEGADEPFWQGVLVDITKVKETEEALKRSEARYRSLIETATDVVFTLGVDGTLTSLNAAFETITGWVPEEWVGREFPPLVHPDDLPAAIELYGRVLNGETPPIFQLQILSKSGEYVPMEFTAGPQLVEGEVVSVLGIARNVSERKRAEQELQRSFDMLRRAGEQRRRLLARLVSAQEDERRRIAADIHDDSIQKMAAVGLRLEALRRGIDQPDRMKMLDQLEETVELSIRRLRHLMFEVRPPALDRDGLAAALRQHLDEVAREGGFQTHLKNGLVTEPSSVTRAIAYRITQEALVNVSKHAAARRVDILLASRDGGLFVRIKDDGVGIAKAETPTAGHLGLSAMRERAEFAGGWWQLGSAPSGGTSVEFWLPLATEEAPAETT